MAFFDSFMKFAEKTYKDNVSPETRERIERELKEKSEIAKTSINDFKTKLNEEETPKETKEPESSVVSKTIELLHNHKNDEKFHNGSNKEGIVIDAEEVKPKDDDEFEDVQEKSKGWFSEKYGNMKGRIEQLLASKETPLKDEKMKELEKAKLISILHIREDGSKLIRIRGVPFVYILDGQSAKDSGKLVWKLGQRAFPYVVEMAVGKIAAKNWITRLGHKSWNFYSYFKK